MVFIHKLVTLSANHSFILDAPESVEEEVLSQMRAWDMGKVLDVSVDCQKCQILVDTSVPVTMPDNVLLILVDPVSHQI